MRRASVLLFAVLLTGCHGTATSLWGRRSMTPEAEALAGLRAAPSLEARHGGIVRDAEAERRLEHIGRLLCRGTPWIQGHYQYRLLGSDRLNASSLPGGRIYITKGLYDRLESDEQVGAVLAHEIAHIVSKDHFKLCCGRCEDAIEREVSADCRGAEYLRRAGIEPGAMIEVVRLIADAQPAGWADARVRSLAQAIRQADKRTFERPNLLLHKPSPGTD